MSHAAHSGGSSAGGQRPAAWRFVALQMLPLGAVLILLAARFWGYAIDDFFITYRYADNLIHGEGFRFNPGEEVFGTTAPGHGLLLAALAALTGAPVPAVGTVATLAGIACICALLIHSAYPRRRWEGVLAAWLVGANTAFWLHAGGEVFTVAALLMTAGHLADRRPAAAGLVAGLAVWARPDAGLGVAALGTLLLVRGRRLPHRFGWTAAAVIAAGLLAAHAWFGSFLPGTLEAKRLQTRWMPGLWRSGEEFWPHFLEGLAGLYFGTALIPLLVFGLVGAVLALRHAGDATRALVLWAAATLVAYPLLGVAMYAWYGIPLVMALLTGLAYAAGAAGRGTARFFGGGEPRRRRGRRAAVAAGLAVALLVVWPVAPLTAVKAWDRLHRPSDHPRLEVYREAGLWLRSNAPADARVAAIEVGTLAYYSRRHVHDVLGLVSPDSLPAIARGDLAAAFRAGDPDHFLFFTPQAGFLQAIVDSPGFREGWEVAHRVRPDQPAEVILYRRKDVRGGTDTPGGAMYYDEATSRPRPEVQP